MSRPIIEAAADWAAAALVVVVILAALGLMVHLGWSVFDMMVERARP